MLNFQVKTGVKGDGVTDLYWFVERSLHPVIDFHGPDSDATKEAKKILKSTIETLSKAFIDGYDGKVNTYEIKMETLTEK